MGRRKNSKNSSSSQNKSQSQRKTRTTESKQNLTEKVKEVDIRKCPRKTQNSHKPQSPSLFRDEIMKTYAALNFHQKPKCVPSKTVSPALFSSESTEDSEIEMVQQVEGDTKHTVDLPHSELQSECQTKNESLEFKMADHMVVVAVSTREAATNTEILTADAATNTTNSMIDAATNTEDVEKDQYNESMMIDLQLSNNSIIRILSQQSNENYYDDEDEDMLMEYGEECDEIDESLEGVDSDSESEIEIDSDDDDATIEDFLTDLDADRSAIEDEISDPASVIDASPPQNKIYLNQIFHSPETYDLSDRVETYASDLLDDTYVAPK